mmetsp:Transcript_141374/g.368131  ORF Transcript_141374/g.368131 Transcript_141374/m.368131 type:complete len:426 (+) Transcript_141374:74-1351(+)
MMATMPRSVGGPLSQAPSFARDAHEFRAVLTAQTAEIDVLKARVAASARECTQLRQRLRDAETELSVAAEATTSAQELLDEHAMRHGLVLAAGVERSGAERATMEHELSRMEALLHDRDIEIRKLRQRAYELEAAKHQNEVELKGLEVAHEATSSRAHAAVNEVSALLRQLGSGGVASSASGHGPSQQEVRRMEEISAILTAKKADHATLKRRTEATSAEAQRLEAEERTLTERLRAFEQGLRAKQEHLDTQDQRSMQESAALREHCEQLRRALQNEQRDSVGVDQRAVLHPQAGAEAEGVKRETAALLETLPRLAAMLQARGRAVCSPPVQSDPVDALLHAYLRTCSPAAADTLPSVIWRLSHGEYLLGQHRVTIIASDGQLVIRDAAGNTAALSNVLHRRTAPAAVPSHGAAPRAAAAQTVNV